MSQTTSYDAVPYPSLPIRRTHPCQLAALARLFGLEPADPKRCRVLELGCASGGNLLPMAADLPEASFLGIDASARQVEQGQAVVRVVGLANVEIRQQDLSQLPADAGLFDYIICHGVYSWVPPAVQEQILAIGRRHLQAHGVLFVSYNTLPGWRLRGVVRDMMRYHVRALDDPKTKVAQSRSLLNFLVDSAIGSGEAYRQLLRDEAAILSAHADAYLYHEHLEDDNEPLYFHQFVERVEAAGLQYLADADFASMVTGNFGEEIAGLLANAPRLVQEQYLDFLRNRTFRASLVCQAERKLELAIDPLRLAACDVALEERLDMPPLRLENDSPWVCRTRRDEVTATAPLTKAALAVLNERWPSAEAFETLFQDSRRRLVEVGRDVADTESHRRRLAHDLMTLLTRRLLRIQADGLRCVPAAGKYPQATLLARWQATQPDGVTNRRHEHLKISDLGRCLLAHLDGRHDRAALAEVLRQACTRGAFEIRRDGRLLTEFDDATLSRIVDQTLVDLAENALLTG